jgi:hypothetical protein
VRALTCSEIAVWMPTWREAAIRASTWSETKMASPDPIVAHGTDAPAAESRSGLMGQVN